MESGWGIGEKERCIRVLCPSKIAASCKEPGLCWLIGSPSFLPPFTIVSSLRCLHSQPDDDPYPPDVNKEADDLRTLLLRGLDVVGALYVGNQNSKENARKAVEESHRLRQMLSYHKGTFPLIGAIADLGSADIQFSISEAGNSKTLEVCSNVVYEDCSEKYMWELGCLLRSELTFKLPVYVPVNRTNAEELFSCVIDAAASKLRDPQVVYLVEGANATSLQPVVLHGKELDFNIDLVDHKILKNTVTEDSRKTLSCSSFLKSKCTSSSSAMESADIIHVSVLCNQSGNPAKSSVPIAEYCPASVPARLVVVNIKLDVLCYASKDFSVASAVSKLIIPGLVDQLATLKKAIIPKLLTQHPRLSPYHFFPPGILHPITAIYDLSSGEMEMPQAEIRRSLHLRLGLPLDRPLLLTANALTFGTKVVSGSNFIKNGSSLIKDVHTEIASSGVSGGLSSLVEGSYEYYHYLQDSFDDSGWGCAYRSLQTIISWFRLQQYTSIEVPSHRGIQKALVEIGDKDPSFVGSREWIGAIELSFVLDKLLGVSCKIINVRSGAELPEKCRELALHFETQGTPVMIGGGVLAYTLLGVDYNDVSGDCAFLILDPHYTGNDEVKRIVNGGWCGWKKAVDSKGRNFFLHDKFYNLLLPQRPNMV